MGKIDYAKELNKQQLAVVQEGDGPCLVLAGAGSGKTRTIIYRVAYLIEQGVPPENILLLTFTNKAAGEMSKRLYELLGHQVDGLWSGTFHSVANRVLRHYAQRIGHTSSFSILDQDDAKTLVKACIKEAGLDKPSAGRRFPSPAIVQEVLSYSHNAGCALIDGLERKYPNFLPLADDFSKIGEMYASKKRQANALDFDDLLARLLELLDKDPEARAEMQNRFRHILVDEYQDTNFIQSAIVSRLADGDRPNVLAVGDDAQSIYSFRAADVRNILDFPNHFPGTRIFKMTVNYRSTPQILDLANDIISNNAEQFQKELRAVKPAADKPRVLPLPSASREALYVADRLEAVMREGVPPSEVAVLFRATFHSQPLEFELMRRGIEYEYRGGLKFFERAHVKDVLAFLRVRANLADEAAWRRLLTMQEGIGEVSAGKVTVAIRESGGLESALTLDIAGMFGNRVGYGWGPLRRALEGLLAAGDRPAEQIKAVLKSSYVDHLESEYPNSRERLEDLEQMAAFAERYERVSEFLAEVSLDDSAYGKDRHGPEPYRQPRLVLSTVHQAKGLEWDSVFVIHLAQSCFPNRNAVMEEGGLEEERRLFYVAVTRAKRQLLLTHPATIGRDAFSYEGPSRFLEEIDPHFVEGMEMPTAPAFVRKSDCGRRSTARRGFDAGDDSEEYEYGDPDYETVGEEGIIELDADGEPVRVPSERQIREQAKRLKAGDWRKKSFLRDV